MLPKGAINGATMLFWIFVIAAGVVLGGLILANLEAVLTLLLIIFLLGILLVVRAKFDSWLETFAGLAFITSFIAGKFWFFHWLGSRLPWNRRSQQLPGVKKLDGETTASVSAFRPTSKR
jgi:hypothetical protein